MTSVTPTFELGKRISVGIIGLNPARGWANASHLPALRALPDFEVKAVCTSRQDSAERAAAHFGIDLAFSDHYALANSPEVDLVVVTVKAPDHYAAAEAAICAGKHVYCEWPVGKTLAETTQLHTLAQEYGVRTVAGLQCRQSRALNHLRRLIGENYIGDVLAVNLLATAGAWGASAIEIGSFMWQKANGATLSSIFGGHSLDALGHFVGQFVELSALETSQRARVKIVETGEYRPMDAPDNIMVHGRLDNGAVAAVHLRGGAQPGTDFRLEVTGSEGVLAVDGRGPFAMMLGELELEGARSFSEPLAPIELPPEDDTSLSGLSAASANVARLYAQFARDLKTETSTVPDFAVAMAQRRLLDTVSAASDSGLRLALGGAADKAG